MRFNMTEPTRRLRADAARNRARLLAVAYETFATEGLAVPIDEIARRAGVGPGTIYRHFATKEALFEAVVEERVRSIIDGAREMLAADPGGALFAFFREVIRTGVADHGLADALGGYGMSIETAAPGAEAAFLGVVAELLGAARQAGTVRGDVDTAELMTLMTLCKSTDVSTDITDRVVSVIIDGLRATGNHS
jgi:AcrR family transcriptional regulator